MCVAAIRIFAELSLHDKKSNNNNSSKSYVDDGVRLGFFNVLIVHFVEKK